MSTTSIEWTKKTWNPVVGCWPVSPGCAHCYAALMAKRIVTMGGPASERYRLTVKYDAAGEPIAKWSGVFVEVPSALDAPLRWKAPTTIFVNSMSDLFGEGVSDEYIAKVFASMAATPHHTYQVLTKRAERLPRWFAWIAEQGKELRDVVGIHPGSKPGREIASACAVIAGEKATGGVLDDAGWRAAMNAGWPLPNVWIGVSVEDQAHADHRIPHLLRVPAVVRFLSVEPMLGPIDLDDLVERDAKGQPVGPGEHHMSALMCDVDPEEDPWNGAVVDWLIVGGESGSGARPFDLAWALDLHEQCAATGVPFFFKQAGARPVVSNANLWDIPDERLMEGPAGVAGAAAFRIKLDHAKGSDLEELRALVGPENARFLVREMPAVRR